MRGATLPQLVRGIHGAVTREDAKQLAKLHGHDWQAVLKALKRRGPRPFAADNHREATANMRLADGA